MELDWCALHVYESLKTSGWLAGLWYAVPALMDWRLRLNWKGAGMCSGNATDRLILSG